jgi:predicted TIM-barrel fold metal-dependent hydrolase
MMIKKLALCLALFSLPLVGCNSTGDVKLDTAPVTRASGVTTSGVTFAQGLPLVDTHFHAMPFMSPDDLLKRIDRHNIQYIGGGHAVGMGRNAEFAAVLGQRYLWAEGSQLIRAYREGGKRALEDVNNPHFQQAFNNIKYAVESGRVRVLGEIFVNTRTSAPAPWRRWKIDANSSAMRALFGLAADHGIPMMVHAQFDSDTVRQLESLAASRPDGVLVLGHCGKDSVASAVRAFLGKTPNAYCNLAYRSAPQETSQDPDRYIWSKSGIKEGWRQLIEDYPDRFMIGIDDVHDWNQFDAVVATIRQDLLANLSQSTAEKLAYQNAKRLYRTE